MKRLLVSIIVLSIISGIFGCRGREETREEKVTVAVEHETVLRTQDRWLSSAPPPFIAGFKLMKGGKYQEALTEFEKVIQLAPTSDWSRKRIWVTTSTHNIGFCDMRLGNYEKAIASFEKVLTRAPNWRFASSSLYNMGFCYERMGRRDEARQAYQEIIDKYPNTYCIWAKQKPIAPLARRRLKKLK